MQPNPIPQATSLPTVARAAYPRRDGAPSPRPVTAPRATDAIAARAAYRQTVADAQEREAAPHASRLPVVGTAGAAQATRQGGAVAGRASTPFLAQHIAQERLPDPSPANSDSPLAAYRDAAERGTVFFSLEYPLDISI